MLLEEKARREARKKIYKIYPDEGPLRRDLYQKHLVFFEAGKYFSERCAMAANRVGKSFGLGGYETALHLTGQYPDWWQGYRFDEPVMCWVAGDTAETTRDIPQQILFGDHGDWGTGLIPGKTIKGTPSSKSGVQGAIDRAFIEHKSGGHSQVQFKAYDQGRKKFQGTSKHFIWLDEEPPMAVYTECRTRIMDVGGKMISTFTPLEGLTEVALQFMPDMAPEEA